MSHSTLARRVAGARALCFVVCLGVAGCSDRGEPQTTVSLPPTPSSEESRASTGSPGPSESPSTSATVQTASTTEVSPPAATSISLSEGDNGQTVTVRVGDAISVVLHATYWSFLAPSNTAVLHADGVQVTTAAFQGCLPGSGCGTATVSYHAISTGRATLAAHRDTCGEARVCTPDEQEWHVDVVVG